jgi:CheY-like chemotaxis protein
MNEKSRAERLEVAGLVAGQIAHDFNNLLTPFLAYPDLIRQEVKQNAIVSEYLDVIEKTAEEMQYLTQQLLVFSRRNRMGAEVFCFNDVIPQVVQTFQKTIPPTITVACELGEALYNNIGSRAQISRVLENLCQNAVEAMGESGTLLIKTENVHFDELIDSRGIATSGDYVKVMLLDSGAGIPEEIREKIFDPYFTTKRATKRRGSGLGLSIVHGIVRDHQGHISFTSEIGQGTTFCLYFPRAKGIEQIPVPATASVPAGGDIDKKTIVARAPRILIADDEQMIRKLFGMIIASEFKGAIIEHALNGDEAVAAFATGNYDLIIMDLQMPGQDGRESFYEIQRICREKKLSLPPIIFCTGFTPSESLVEIINDSSVHCLLRKPVKAELLLGAVRQRLRR